MPDEENVIEASGLTKRFDARVAVDAVDLRVPRACAFGFLGPNGAGKTTVIRMLLGLTGADAGTMRVLGHELPAGRAAALARVGAIVEEPRFHPFLSGRENLRIVAAVRDEAAFGRIDGALARVGLADRANERVGRYSLGMRQRLGIARCLLADPELLILDEPMNGLDPAGMDELRHLIRSLVDEGRTVFLSSHLLDEVEKTCDAVAIVDHGRIVRQGRIAEVAGGDAPALAIRCADPARALAALAALPAVARAEVDGALVRVELAGGDEAAAAVVRELVGTGLDVYAVEPVRISLEERFLELTSRLGA